jgi:hypothetical protein
MICKAEKRHESAVVRIHLLKDLKIFESNWRIEYCVNDQYLLSVEPSSEEVKKKRAMLTYLRHVFCVLGNLVLIFHGHDESVRARKEDVTSRC